MKIFKATLNLQGYVFHFQKIKYFHFYFILLFDKFTCNFPIKSPWKYGLERGSARRTPGCHSEELSFRPASLPSTNVRDFIFLFLHSSCHSTYEILSPEWSTDDDVSQNGVWRDALRLVFFEKPRQNKSQWPISTFHPAAHGSRFTSTVHWFIRERYEISTARFSREVTPTEPKDAHMASSTIAHLFLTQYGLCPISFVGSIHHQ